MAMEVGSNTQLNFSGFNKNIVSPFLVQIPIQIVLCAYVEFSVLYTLEIWS